MANGGWGLFTISMSVIISYVLVQNYIIYSERVILRSPMSYTGGHDLKAIQGHYSPNKSTGSPGYNWSSPLHDDGIEKRGRARVTSSRKIPDVDEESKFDKDWGLTRRYLMSGERKLPRFIHFHKVGGTGVCLAAQRNGEMVNVEATCNSEEEMVQKLLEPQLAGEFARLSCQERYNRLRIYSFVASETFLEIESCPQYFHYIANIRPPIDRIQSHLTAHRMSALDTVKWLQGAEPPIGHLQHGIMEAFFDNYYIRFLLGPSVFYLPTGSLTRDHLDRAKRKLRETFAVIVPLHDQKLVHECLEPIFRWYDIDFGHENPNNGYLEQNADALDYLRQSNSLDEELYNYAVNISLSCKLHLIQHVHQLTKQVSN
eukprot:gb/GECG01005441.1/.p1 GENE.gb/GECG01005441.1/~~gb/GECG01005441.1/.p1  ORF type:complete len:372 (+),score=24.47 gb/GECG01005441.1/:1-1116(+)